MSIDTHDIYMDGVMDPKDISCEILYLHFGYFLCSCFNVNVSSVDLQESHIVFA
jgi:hypothetical protein